MKKLYFASQNDEICYDLSYFKDKMKTENLDSLELYEAEISDIKGYFWCNYYQEIGDKSEGTCGKSCKAYKPRNGKNGCCSHYSTRFYEPSDRTIILKK